MNVFFDIDYSWTHFFGLAALLALIGFALKNGSIFIGRNYVFGPYHRQIRYAFRMAKLLFEPVALLVLFTAFVLVNPAFHGTLLVLFFIGAARHLRDYVSSRFVRFDPAISIGNRLRVGSEKGVIIHIGRFGIRLKTRQGIFYQNYSNLLSQGYVLATGDEIGGFYSLRLKPNEDTAKTDHKTRLLDLLATAPYLDWNHRPEIRPCNKKAGQLKARVLVKEKQHLYDLVALINEWGYTCKIGKK